MGCSTGGRQGLVEAQRFPWDFDGIIAGAPVINASHVIMTALWRSLAVAGEGGNPIFNQKDARLVDQAAVSACDRNDGLQDGVIEDPRTCRFDPASLACKAGKTSDCLSAHQVQAARTLYAGLVNSKGERLIAGVLPGSGIGDPAAVNPVRDFFRYMAFFPDPGPRWQSSDFNFEQDYKRFGTMEALYSAANPDLRRFKAAGGKLILYHGWSDFTISPLDTIDYYESAVRTMGGRSGTEDFARLFMIPGMQHCIGGEGAFAIDYLSYLEAWVEEGRPPDRVLSAHVEGADASAPLEFPLDPTLSVTFTRPVYPYPLQVRYRGSGDPRDAANFVSARP
jgi:feruloyl esterase